MIVVAGTYADDHFVNDLDRQEVEDYQRVRDGSFSRRRFDDHHPRVSQIHFTSISLTSM